MGWRSIMVEHPARISVKQSQLIISGEYESSLPIEDLNVVLIESRQAQITSTALSCLAQEGVALMVCDDHHLPCGVLLPYAQHSRSLAVARMQVDAGEARKKRLWQQLVKAKIANQARCLRMFDLKQAADKLESYAHAVVSGDKDNMEAVAAAVYFRALFGEDFRRGQDNGINAALNYGYAILRGLTARSLAVYGFLSCFGLYHRSELNPFNLTDDMMEPLRPVVDLYVAKNVSPDQIMTSQLKRELFTLLGVSILSGGQRYAISGAVERSVQSLVRGLQLKGQPSLMLPELLALEQHRYE